MPRRTLDVHIEMWDYFSNYGFGNGDDSAAVNMGYEFRPQAVDIINRCLAAVGVDCIRAVECDPGGSNNNCCIELIRTDDHRTEAGDCIDILEGVVSGIYDPDLKAKVVRAISMANAEFDADEAPGRDEEGG